MDTNIKKKGIAVTQMIKYVGVEMSVYISCNTKNVFRIDVKKFQSLWQAVMYHNKLDRPHHKDHLIIHQTNHIEFSYNEV